jgi:HK97 family phage major capsid protein
VLDRFKNRASHRDTHFGDQIGVIEGCDLQNAKLYVDVRYSKSKRGTEVLDDVDDGIRCNVSLRYIIHEMVLEREEDGVCTYRVTKWEPVHTCDEIDPADFTVGHGRSREEGDEIILPFDPAKSTEDQLNEFNRSNPAGLKVIITKSNKRSDITMPEEKTPEQLAAERAQAIKDAEKSAELRVASIYAMANDYQANVPKVKLMEEARKFVAEGKSDNDFRAFIMEKMKSTEAGRSAETELGLTEEEKNKYSFRNVVLALAGGSVDKLGVEFESSRALAKKFNREQTGKNIFIPYDAMIKQIAVEGKRDLNVGTPSQGGYTVQYQYTPKSFIEILTNSMITPQLGVTVMENLTGDVPMTRELSDNIFYWVAEGNGPTQSDVTFGQQIMRPKTGGALTKLTHQFLTQNSVGGEAYAVRKIATACGVGYDKGALYGIGGDTQPLGLKNQTGLGGIAGANFNRASALNLVKQVKVSNALQLGMPKWLAGAGAEETLKNKVLSEVAAKYLWDDETNKMVGYEAKQSNQMVDDDLFFGIWQSLILGMWNVIEVKANEFGAGFAAGIIEVRALVDMDVFVEHPSAFTLTPGVN